MSSTTVMQSGVGVKPDDPHALSYAQAFDTIAELIAHGAPHPTGFAVQGYGADPRLDNAILTLSFDAHEPVHAWASLLGFTEISEPRSYHSDDHHEYDIHEAHAMWFGWSTWLRSRAYVPVPVLFGEDCTTCRAFRLDGPIETPPPACDCEVVHPLGCPGDVPEHLADHFAVDLQRTPECPSCGVLNGAHQPHCYAVSRVDPDAAAQIPVVVVELPQRTPGAALVDEPAQSPADDVRRIVAELADVPDVSLKQLAETVDVTPDARIHYVPTDAHLRRNVREVEAPAATGRCRVVDVLTVDPDLTDDRSGAEMAHLNGATS